MITFATDTFEFDAGESFIDELNVIENSEQFKDDFKKRCNIDEYTEMQFLDSSEIMLDYIIKTFGIKLFLTQPVGKYKGNLIEAKSHLIHNVNELNNIGLNENSILYDVKYIPAFPKIINEIPTIVGIGYWRIRVV
jgi:hypothetical protein